MERFDFAIIGGGLAGATLAWRLRERGQKVVIIDRDDLGTASRIAAGLMSPISGQRNVRRPDFVNLLRIAETHYRKIEALTGTIFFELRKLLHLAGEPQEFELAGRLDASTYIDASRDYFAKTGSFRRAEINLPEDIDCSASQVVLWRHGIESRRLIFCQGFTSKLNHFFSHVVFQPAKGEVLTLAIPELREERILKGDVWLLPLGDRKFLAGSTYDRVQLNSIPTDAGRQEILEKIRQFVPLAIEVLDHRAAVRPIIVPGGDPLYGLHPTDSRLGFFNGLGSKGALMAPTFAERFAAGLVNNSESLPRLDEKSSNPIRVTEEAKRLVAEVLQSGEIAIDATAGNGQDTRFLAELVGSEGSVFAFDIQMEAIERCRWHLAKADISNVTLLQQSHSQMLGAIPKDQIGKVCAVMFNLGYLPSGPKETITRVESTIPAIEQALSLLRLGGIATIAAYRGHPGGREETCAVRAALNIISATGFSVREIAADSREDSPVLFVVRKVKN